MLTETPILSRPNIPPGRGEYKYQPHLPSLQSELIHKPEPSTPAIDALHPFPVTEEGKDLGEFAQTLLHETGLPLTRITQIAYIPNHYGNHDVLGSYEIGGDHHGRLSFYKNMERIPALGQFAVAMHEGAHASSPFNTEDGTDEDYGGKKNRERAALNVIRVANQASSTGIFLNGYHEYIYHLKESGQLSKEQWQRIWLEETHAIASELAATNYKHLQQVEQRQFYVLKRQDNIHDFVPLTSRQNEKTGKVYPSGIEQTLMDLTKIQTVQQLHDHWNTIHAKYDNATTPFHQIKRDRPTFLPLIPGTEFIVIQVIYLRRTKFDNDPLEELLERAGLRRRDNIISSAFV